MQSDEYTDIGYVNDTPDPVIPLDTISIPERHRLHAMVLGSSGYGKSTVLKLLIRQNLIRGEGLAVLDPHHDLAAWTARRIPRNRANQLVYISPDQLSRTSKAIPINPLETYMGAPGVAATAFAETLLKAFDTKGVRMEQVLVNAATALIASGRGGLGLLRRIIIDKSERDAVLANVHLQDNLDYWERVFPNMAREAVPAVDNKLTPIVSNPAVGPFFEGDTGFDMEALLDGGGILIFDGAGCNNDSERMIFTTFLLNMITTSATRLAQSRPQGVTPTPFWLYVDEMQMLESDKLKEMLQQVRKWGIRMTLSTQQLESIDAGNAAAMIGNCDLYMVSRCTPFTAKLISSKMAMDPDELTKIPKFHMNYHMGIPEGDIHGRLLRTRNMDKATASWDTLEEIVDHSLTNYGIDVDLTKYTNEPEHAYDVSPLEMAILCILYHKYDGLGIDDIHKGVERFGAAKRRAKQLLNHMVRSGMVETFTGNNTTYRLRTPAIDRYFDVAALKGRAGGDLHIGIITAMQDHYTRRGYYTRMDTGDATGTKPDLEVCEPAVGPDGSPDATRWGRRVAVEVETGPGRHPNKPGAPGQVYKNWLKCHKTMSVWYIVFNSHNQDIIQTQLDQMGVTPEQYRISVVIPDDILNGTAIPMPSDFVPADTLPFCEPRVLDHIILEVVGDGITMVALRQRISAVYDDKQLAEAVDRLTGDGRLKSERRKGDMVLVA